MHSVGGLSRREILKISAALAGSGVFLSTDSAATAQPGGQLTWGVHVSLAPTWFDPAETPGTLIPFMVMYALHDAMVKPLPGQPLAPSLAESWTVSEDVLTYEFVLREDAKFHNGDDVTVEDVKFSFERYRGSGRHVLKDRVAARSGGCASSSSSRGPTFSPSTWKPPELAGSCPRRMWSGWVTRPTRR